MQPLRVAFVGFGEVAAVFSAVARAAGASVAAYDHNLDEPGGDTRIRRRARTDGIRFLPLADALAGADLVLSTVSSRTALDAARACAPHLRPSQLYVDLNSTPPALKVEIGRSLAASGAGFAEGAVLGAVGAAGASVRILTGGPRGEEAARALGGLGLRAEFYSPDVGRASVFKMLRSIFSKGLEALLLELRVAGRRAGIEQDLWQDVLDFMKETPFDAVASNWILSHPAACARRHREMEEVVGILRELGVDPIMSAATESFFRRSSGLGLSRSFPERPASPDAVVQALGEAR
jgi:3-hydroxyisobutyrate dehydrogenase